MTSFDPNSLKRGLLIAALLGWLLTFAFAQLPKRTGQEPASDEVVRISVRLVQVDGTVTDKEGRPVTDLSKDDFELFVDGRPQKITSFSYISAQPRAKSARPTGDTDSSVPAPAPPMRLRPEQVRRTIALVIANVSFDTLRVVKKALHRFVDEQMRPGDLVSVIRPGEGAGVLQQFTTDKRLLHLAIDGVRWNPIGEVGVAAVTPEDPKSTDPEAEAARKRDEGFYKDTVAAYWLKNLYLIVRGLEDLPGRKAVVLFSGSIRLFGPDQDNRRTMDAVHRITDLATRTMVVFYTIDSRGLQTLNSGASEGMDMDALPGIGGSLKPATARDFGAQWGAAFVDRIINFWKDQDGLALLAEETGGKFSHSTDPGKALSSMFNDQKGYYVLGYRPEEDTFKVENGRRPYHHISVTVKRAGLRSHFRKGFYGTPDREPARAPSTPSQKLLSALTSPFDTSDVAIRLTSLFGYDPTEGPFVRSLLHIDGRGLTLIPEPGKHRAMINVFTIALDERGPLSQPVAQKYTVRVLDERLEKIRREGLVYELMTPVGKPGIYQIRAVVQDVESDRMGSASQLIEVPDLKNKRLSLSGIVVAGESINNSTAPGPGAVANQESAHNIEAGPAVRRFHRGMRVRYAFIILNAQPDQGTGRPHVLTQVVLYHEGKAIFTGPTTPIDLRDLKDPNRVVAGGTVNLGAELQPGEYILQLIVTDSLAREKKYQTSTRWIDFDVID